MYLVHSGRRREEIYDKALQAGRLRSQQLMEFIDKFKMPLNCEVEVDEDDEFYASWKSDKRYLRVTIRKDGLVNWCFATHTMDRLVAKTDEDITVPSWALMNAVKYLISDLQ